MDTYSVVHGSSDAATNGIYQNGELAADFVTARHIGLDDFDYRAIGASEKVLRCMVGDYRTAYYRRYGHNPS